MSTKRSLVVVVAAGASVESGISNTSRLTETAKRAMPTISIPGVSHGGTTQPYRRFDRSLPLAAILDQPLRTVYGNDYDFEILLNAIEELEAFVSARHIFGTYQMNTAVLAAFAELMRRYECINDDSLLRETRLDILKAVHSQVGSDSEYPTYHDAKPAREQIERLFKALAECFRLVVIDFNYDDLIDRLPITWQDGFTRPVSDRGCQLFSPDDWNRSVADASSHLLMHIHGSVRFGYRPQETLTANTRFAEPAKYDSIMMAQQSIVQMSVSGTYVLGKPEDASFIVSGLGKVGKVTYNARPYGYYYRTIMDLVPRTEHLLVLGYGWRDYHVNTWIREYVALHPNRRSAVVTLRPGWEVGKNTSLQYQSLQNLAGTSWNRIETLAYLRRADQSTEPSRFLVEGNFAIAPEGFIMSDEDEHALTEFITA